MAEQVAVRHVDGVGSGQARRGVGAGGGSRVGVDVDSHGLFHHLREVDLLDGADEPIPLQKVVDASAHHLVDDIGGLTPSAAVTSATEQKSEYILAKHDQVPPDPGATFFFDRRLASARPPPPHSMLCS